MVEYIADFDEAQVRFLAGSFILSQFSHGAIIFIYGVSLMKAWKKEGFVMFGDR